MKKPLATCGLLLLVGLTALAANQGGDTGTDFRNQFVGAWHLVWLERPGADGKTHRVDCSGLLVYTSDGHMSVQVMERNPQAQGPAAPEQYSQGGYEASWGTYTIDERTHTFIFHVDGALVRALVGKDLPRAYELSGNRLIVKSAHTNEHWRVAWQRY